MLTSNKKKNDKQIYDELNIIFISIFDDPNISITESTSAKDIPQWDSLAQIRIVLAVEKRFQIHFTVDEVVDFKTVGEMVECMKKKYV